jgi:two-component system OmpR family sensor kinase
MDGLKERLNRSVQLRLSLTLSLAVALVALAAGTFSFFSALGEAHELQDDVLYQIAGLVEQQRLSLAPAIRAARLSDSDGDSTVFVQRLGTGNAAADKAEANGVLPLPSRLADGLHTLEIGGKSFRVLVKTPRTGERIAVSQETDTRDEIAFNSALHTLLPFLVLVPILLLVIGRLVRKMFRPITDLSRRIDARPDYDLRPVYDDHLPIEVRPFILAINRLLARVAESVDTQRRFIADAAHELRSPFAALSLQAERLEQAGMSATARERFKALQRGIERGRNLLNQLLSLSRSRDTLEARPAPISVQDAFRRVVEDLLPLARAKHIDIGAAQGPDARVGVAELDLMTIVKNLIDNAIRYMPEGGRVDLSISVEDAAVTLLVSDTGPGIAAAERERVLDPFYRVLGSDQVGSGLGLSIVKTICDRIGAGIALSAADEASQSGLAVAVTLPRSSNVPQARAAEPLRRGRA